MIALHSDGSYFIISNVSRADFNRIEAFPANHVGMRPALRGDAFFIFATRQFPN
jgi:hypothetical protein